MQILIDGKPFTPEKDREIVTALWGVSNHEGLISETAKEDGAFSIHGKAVDLYLLTAVLAVRLAAGDVELVEKGDKAHKKAYQQKLMAEIQRDWCEGAD